MYLLLSFILNFCLTFSLIYVVSILFFLGIGRSDNASRCPIYSSGFPFDNMQFEDEKESGGRIEEGDDAADDSDEDFEVEESVEINDLGFTIKGFQVWASDIVNITVSNTGSKAHSFVIDELNIDSGIIGAGESKLVRIESLPNEEKIYNFYSNASDDKANGFGGIMLVSKE